MGGSDPRKPCGFDRQSRLLAAAEFSAAFAARRVLRGECFVLHYRPNGAQGARLGLVIPKKLARLAVLRNAVKRQARECFRRQRGDLPSCDVVLRLTQPLALPGPVDREVRAAWRKEITALLSRLAEKAQA